jgi:hypothetical protein
MLPPYKRIETPPTSTSPDTAKASVRGVRSPCSSNGDAAAVDCWAGGVPEDDAGVPPVDAVGVMEPVVTLDRSELKSELGIGVSPGGMPIEPSEIPEVTPPVCHQQRPHMFCCWCLVAHMVDKVP